MVAVVLADVELVNVIDPLELHDRNTNPEFGEAVIEREPESSQRLVPVGFVEPVPEGETANVI